ncbi:MAG: LLM class flavin-dependent oxidoreductase [Pseudomonadota bacterium]
MSLKSVGNRNQVNPFYNGRKLKLGTFSTNLHYGAACTTIDGTLKADWPSIKALSKLQDEMEFEAIVPVARWRGFGGKTNFAGPGFETYTFAAGVGAQVDHCAVVATSHVPLVHPIMAAKQMITIDHITGGRSALNVVTGWNRPEIEMFGIPLREHDERYDMAVEWLELVKRLWTEEEDFDFEGRFYKINKGYAQPKPIQKPYPPIMNAGGSDRGRHYAAKYCDIAFVPPKTRDLAVLKADIDSYKTLAREEYGNNIQVWTNTYVVQGETEKEAHDFLNYYANQHGDWEAGTQLVETMGLNAKTFTEEQMRGMKQHFMAGWGGYPIVGTKEQIVDTLQKLSDCGFDGVLLTFARFHDAMVEFRNKTYPLLVQAGLR